MTPVRKFILFWILFCGAAGIGGAAWYNFQSFELPNGFKVILSPQPDSEAAAVTMYGFSGVSDDPPEIRGASYLYQFLMFQGTQNLEPYDQVFFITRAGGQISGRVNYDNAVFTEVVPASEVNIALWLESERLKSLRLGDNEISAQKNQVYTRINRLLESSATLRAETWINERIFAGTPYELPLYGDLQRLRAIDNDQIREIYDRFRNPANILLVICGKYDIFELKKGISDLFQNLPPASKITRALPQPREAAAGFMVKNWVLPNLFKSFTIYGLRMPPRNSYDYLYVQFLKYYLGDPRISRLPNLLKNTYKLNVEFQCQLTDYFDANALTFSLSSASRADLEKAKTALNRELEAFQKSDLWGYKGPQRLISSNDIRSVKSLMEIDFLKRFASLEERGRLIAELYHLTGRLDSIPQYLARLQQIGASDIIRVGQKYLNKGNWIILNAYPEK